jgi:hypothetical protein
MDIDLKTLAPDNTIPAGAVLFGADSQGAAQPSVYPVSDVVAVATNATAAAANTFTADQTIAKATPVLRLNKAASGQFASYRGATNGILRWDMPLGNDTAETGSNAGSDFELASYNDAGTGRAVRMRIRRSDGYANLLGNVEIGTPDAGNSLLLRRRGTASGGLVTLERGASGNTLASDVRIAVEGNSLQIGEAGGTQRGFSVDLTTLSASFGTLLTGGGADAQIFTTPGAGTWTKPAWATGNEFVLVLMWPGGGGGSTTASQAGGGGGQFIQALFRASSLNATESLSVGAAGAIGAAGGNSTFKNITAFGGGPGVSGTGGGQGGGVFAAGAAGGQSTAPGAGGLGATGAGAAGGNSVDGGGGGGATTGAGGNSLRGGAGGGGSGAGGTSGLGGNGGGGGVAGSAPGGGGGAGAAGGRGEIRIYTFR